MKMRHPVNEKVFFFFSNIQNGEVWVCWFCLFGFWLFVFVLVVVAVVFSLILNNFGQKKEKIN